MAFSNTVSETVFTTQKLMDHAFRRAKIPPQKITREYIQTFKDLAYMILSTWSSKGLALWAIQTHLLPMYYGKQTVPCPLGTVDVLNTNIRSLQRLDGTADASEGTADNAFDGDIETACVQTVADGWISLDLEEEQAVTNFGILAGASGSWAFTIDISEDNSTWTTVYTGIEDMVDGEWFWWDVEGIPLTRYIRLKATDGTILDVRELVFANTPQEIPLAKINRDDYMNMPNKTFLGRPVQFYYDKQVARPNMVIWPAPQEEYTFQQIVVTTQRYIMDPGSLTDSMEVPQGGFLFLAHSIAYHLAIEIDEAKASPADLFPEMQRLGTEFWAGQTDSSPVKLTPNISPYTR